MPIIIKLVILAVAVFVGAYIIPGVTIDSPTSLAVVAIVLAIINTFIKPVLVILTLPLTILTLGIFFTSTKWSFGVARKLTCARFSG